MRIFLLFVLFAFIALGASTAAAQESKAVFKGTAENSSGLKFSDWDLTLFANQPLVLKQTINVRSVHTFNFKAAKGQKLSVEVVSKEPSTGFVIYENWDEGEQIGESTEEDRSWRGVLRADGDYKIVLSTDARAAYTITVKLN